MSSATLGGRPEASFKVRHTKKHKNHSEFLGATHFVKKIEARLQRKSGSLPHTPWFLLASLCLGTSLLLFCDGSALRPFGRWARAMGTGRLQCWVVEIVCSRKTTRGAKAVCLCMIQPFIMSVFQNLGSRCFFQVSGVFFFRNPVDNFAGLR